MESKVDNSDPASDVKSAYSVRCTQEVLLPFFTDECQPVAMERDVPPVSPGVLAPLPELRLVLLGRKGAGKSSAGNTILGGTGAFESGKPTEECVKRRADVARRQVTVVDTPGWEWYYPLNSTPDWVRRETLRSVTLCPPGPHAVLLVVRSCTSVTEAYTRQIEDHLDPLGKGVWDRTMLLFTRGDELGLVSMEQRILTCGPALKSLLQRCGRRYHVLDNRSKGDGTQVAELMRKIEEVAERCGHLGVDNTVLSGLEADRKRRARERRKKQRQLEAQTQRTTIKAALMSDGPEGPELDARQSFSKGPRRLPELRLVLLGERETGKSSCGNTVLGAAAAAFRAGSVTEECARRQAEVSGRLVTVVDTPGWEGGVAGPTPERVRREVAASATLCPPGPHAVLLTLRVDTLVTAPHVKEHLELLGGGVWRHTVLVFTHGDQLREGVGIEQHIQSGGRDLRWLLDQCRGRYHVISNAAGGGGPSQVTELLDKVETMAAGNRCEAFSGLVQEVRELGRQKNDRFRQRLRETADKLQRQEAELKKMREREVKSIRWFFERRKKPKSPSKAAGAGKEERGEEEEEEEEEEGRGGGGGRRKKEMVELEERMRWLTEDKEREMQDLNAEHDRVLAALHHSERQREEASHRLELREREMDELTERLDEQQMKTLELERALAEGERERRRREDEVGERQQAWTREERVWSEVVELSVREEAELREAVEALRGEALEMKRRHEEALSRGEREGKIKAEIHNRELVEVEYNLKATGARLSERESEVDALKDELGRALQEKKAALEAMKQCEKDMGRKLYEKVEEMKSQHQKEMTGKVAENEEEVRDLKLRHEVEMSQKIHDIEKLMEAMNIQHQEEMDRVLKEKEEDKERVKKQYDDEIRDTRQEAQRVIKEMKHQLEKELERNLQESERQFQNILEEKTEEHKREKEKINLSHKTQMTENLQEKEKEIAVLRKEHTNEINSNLQEYENNKKAMEHSLENREREIEAINQRIKQMAEQLQERESDDLNYKVKAELEIVEMKCYIREIEENLKTKDEEVKTSLNHSIEVEQRLQQKAKDIEEMRLQFTTDINKTLQEKQAEIEWFKQQAETRETKWREEQRKKNEGGEQENNRLIQTIEDRTQEVTKLRQLVSQREKEIQEANERCANHLEEIKRLKEKVENAMCSITEIQQRRADQERKREAEIMERLGEKDDELNSLRERHRGNEREIALLRQTIEQTKTELKELTNKMEREMTSMIEEYENELASTKEKMDSILKDKEQAVRKMQQTEDDGKRRFLEITEKYEEGQARAKSLQEQNGQMTKDLEKLKSKCEEHKTEYETQQSREEEIRERLSRYEEQLRAGDSESQNLLHEKARELTALKETNEKLHREIKKWMERATEKEKTRDLYETQLTEKQKQLDMRNEILEKEFAERESRIEMRDLNLQAKEVTLNKRACELDAKQEAVTEREGKLERREQQLAQWQADVDLKQRQNEKDEQETRAKGEEILKREQNIRLRVQNIEKREREVESCLQDLENKQLELNTYGLDIQKKVKELRDWGKGLEDKEHLLKNEEQEMLSWRAQLEQQNECVASKHQQLDGIGKDLARLQEELRNKEKEKLLKRSEREQCIEERDTESHVRKLKHPDEDHEDQEVDGRGLNGREANLTHGNTLCNWTAANDRSGVADDAQAMYQEVGVVDEQGWGEEKRGKRSEKDGSHKCREDERKQTACSATLNNSCQLETPEDVFDECENNRMTDGEMVKERVIIAQNRDKGEEALDKTVTIDSKLLSPGQGHRAATSHDLPGSELRLVILAENRSSRCSAGVAILGQETSWPVGSPPRPWRGQVAGRSVRVIEPPGLRWRNGPEATDTELRKRILESISQLNPGPHVVLLVIPAYLTCTRKYRKALEEHIGLLGEDIWQRTLVLLTWGETLGESAEQHILRNGDLMRLVEKCRGQYYLLTSKKNNSLLEGLFEKIEEMVSLNNNDECFNV